MFNNLELGPKICLVVSSKGKAFNSVIELFNPRPQFLEVYLK